MVLAIYYYTKIEEDGVWCKRIKKVKALDRYAEFGMIVNDTINASNWNHLTSYMFYGVPENTWKQRTPKILCTHFWHSKTYLATTRLKRIMGYPLKRLILY